MRASRIALVTLAALVAPREARADSMADGKKALAERRWVAAADAFRGALATSPTHRDAAVGLAKATAEGQLADHYEEAIARLSAALKAKPDDREARLAYGYLFLARAKTDERFRADAQEQFLRLTTANP